MVIDLYSNTGQFMATVTVPESFVSEYIVRWLPSNKLFVWHGDFHQWREMIVVNTEPA
jgi:hypothetical protein